MLQRVFCADFQLKHMHSWWDKGMKEVVEKKPRAKGRLLCSVLFLAKKRGSSRSAHESAKRFQSQSCPRFVPAAAGSSYRVKKGLRGVYMQFTGLVFRVGASRYYIGLAAGDARHGPRQLMPRAHSLEASFPSIHQSISSCSVDL